MALYSTSVETAIYDPVFSSTRRCEFRLPDRDGALLPNLRLGNIGVSTASDAVPYALGCGVASLIKRIQLMDGNEELDSLREANAWLTFKSFFRTNAEASSIKMVEQGGAGRGFTSSTNMEITVPDPSKKYAVPTTVGPQEIFTGYIDLRVVFPILNQMTHLNTKIFPNLRVVIEYETSEQRILTTTGNSPVPTTPILMADVITDDALIASLDKQMMAAPVLFDAIEVDRIGLPVVKADPFDASDGEVAQNQTLQSKGFLGKYVKRICVQKSSTEASRYVDTTPTPSQVRGFGANGSLAMHKEQANLRINGRNLLGGNGYTTAAQFAMGVADTWGQVNTAPYMALESVGLDLAAETAVNAPAGVPPTNPSIRDSTTAANAKQSAIVGQGAYIGFRVDERCDNLQLQYQRAGRFQTAGKAPGTGGPLNLTLYAEVSKRLDVRGPGDWAVSYV